VTPIEGVLNVNPAAVLVFVDETGPEWFEDPNYPLFALGGLVVPALSYFETVSGAWENLKGRHFGGRSVRLHAAEIDRSNSAGISAIGDFFRELEFGRIAVALTVRTGRPAELPPYQVAASALLPRLVAVVRWIERVDSIALVVEQSSRGDRLAKQYLSGWRYWREASGEKVYIPVSRHLMPKSAGQAGLEIADFVMYAVGGRTRERLEGRHATRADFKCV
jgi:hypothetical protein